MQSSDHMGDVDLIKRVMGGSVQLLSHVRLLATPWTAHLAFPSFTVSQSLLRLTSIK